MACLDELLAAFIRLIAMKDVEIEELENQIEAIEPLLKYYQDKWLDESLARGRMHDGDDAVRRGVDEVDR